MLRALSCATIGICLMLTAASTYAREAELALEGRFGGDSNVFRQPEYPKSSSPSGRGSEKGYWEFVPSVKIRERKAPLSYEASYQAARQEFFGKSSLTGWNHYGRLQSTWLATQADTVRVGGGFVDERRLQLTPGEVSGENPGDPDLIVTQENGRQRIRRSRADFSYTRSLDPRRSITVDYDFVDLDFVPNSNPSLNAVDTRAHTLQLQPLFVLHPNTSVGFGLGGRYRENFGNNGRADSEVLTGDLMFTIEHQFAPNTKLSASAGPSIINTKVKASGFPTDETNDVSWFAVVNLRQEWRHSSLDLSYNRFESASGGSGGSSIVDQVLAVVNYRLGEHWDMDLIASWNHRSQLVKDTIGIAFPDEDTMLARVSGTVRYNLTERASVIGTTQYIYQESEFEGARKTRFQVFTGFVAFRYAFEPLQF